MRIHVLYLLLTAAGGVHGASIPFLQDAFFRPTRRNDVDEATVFNGTCDECLCKALDVNASYVALNCFDNHTCQLFPTLRTPCEIPRSTGAQLYFLQGVPSTTRQYCIPNITEIVNRLKNATPKVISLSFQVGGLGYDETKPNEAVVIGVESGYLHWFNPINMTSLRNQTIATSLTIALHNNNIFTGRDTDPTIHILDERNLAPVTNITYPSLNQVRKFIFLNNGRTIVVPTQSNFSVTILDVQSPTLHTIQVSIASTVLLITTLVAGNCLSIISPARCGEGQ